MRLRWVLAWGVLAALSLPSAAGANQSLTPFNRNFGDVKVGATSSPFVFRLTALCDDDPAAYFYQCQNVGGDPPLPVSISVSNGFTQTNDCPPTLSRAGIGTEPVTSVCTITVRFAPSAERSIDGLLRTGTTAENPFAAISGTGVVPGASAKKKKCKKKKQGAAAKKRKCKRK